MVLLSKSADGKHPYHIVVVDDITSAAEFFAQQLLNRFEQVTPLSPHQVVGFLRSNEVGAVVTDLRFVGDRMLDNGLQLLRLLGENCPPSVLLTTSISGSKLSNIMSQAVHTDGTPFLRGAMKGNGIDLLVAQILGTMADAKKVPTKARIAGIGRIKIPEFNSGEFAEELRNVIAILSEKLKIYVRETKDILNTLSEKHDLQNWPTWQAIQHTVEGQLAEFERCNSEKLCGNSEHDAMNVIHELNNRIILLDMYRFQIPEESDSTVEAAEMLRKLQGSHSQISSVIQNAYQAGEQICNPSFDFEDDVRVIFRGSDAHLHISHSSDVSIKIDPQLNGEGRILHNFFREIRKHFDSIACTIHVRAIDEDGILWDGHKKQEILQRKIGWGSGYEVSISLQTWGNGKKYIGMTYEQVLDGMRGILEKLRIAKKIYLDPQQLSQKVIENKTTEITIMLKSAELDKETQARKRQEAEKVQSKKTGVLSMNGEKIDINTLTIPSGKITLIGFEGSNKMSDIKGAWSCLLCDGEIIIANMGHGHTRNEQVLCYYLFRRKKLTLPEAYQLATESMRLDAKRGTIFVDFNKENEEWKKQNGGKSNDIAILEKLSRLLPESGIQKIVTDYSIFYGRSGLEWTTVAHWAEPKGQAFFEKYYAKDEWFDEEQ